MDPRNTTRWSDAALLGTIARSIWHWQLAVAFGAVTVGVGVVLLDPQLFEQNEFLGGFALLALYAIGCERV